MRISPPLLAALLALAPSLALAQGAPAPIRLPKGSTGPADGLTVSGRPLSSIIDVTNGKLTLKPDAITGDGSGLNFTVRGMTATVDRLLSTRTPRAWGADPALPNNAAAIKFAMESGIPIVFDAIYPVTTPITVNGCPSATGGNPALVGILWTAGGGGLTINCTASGLDTSKSGVNLSSFGLYTTATNNGGSPLNVNFSAQVPAQIIHPNGWIKEMRISGRDINTQSWSDFTKIKNAQGFKVYDNFVAGRFGGYDNRIPATSVKGGFYMYNDPGAPSHANIFRGNVVFQTDMAIEIQSFGDLGVEGISIIDNVLVSNIRAVKIDNGAAGYAPPNFVIKGNQLQVMNAGIEVINSAQVFIDDNGIYIDKAYEGKGSCGYFKNSNMIDIGSKGMCLNTIPERGGDAWVSENTYLGQFGGGGVQYFTNALKLDATSTDWTVYPFSSIDNLNAVVDVGNKNLVMRQNGASLEVPGLNVTAGNRLLEIGSTGIASDTGIDFHSSGTANDYDSRIKARGGTPGTSGAGILSLISGILEITGKVDWGGATSYFDNAAQAFVWTIGGTEVGRLDSGAWTDWTPTVSCGSGSPGSATAMGRYRKAGKTVQYNLKVSIATNGSCGVFVDASLPFGARTAGIGQYPGSGYGEGPSSDSLRVVAFGATVRLTKYNNQAPSSDGAGLYASGTYELP